MSILYRAIAEEERKKRREKGRKKRREKKRKSSKVVADGALFRMRFVDSFIYYYFFHKFSTCASLVRKRHFETLDMEGSFSRSNSIVWDHV